ncbi:hypothetical protein BACCOPRO_02530 [Phocaeicola coprophilus DSM 18228 = JCM 13818]|uniref:Uncharacterized protein n=1 Tax=Phocaeicola coprophilus DSM 18228 = JCM 13818 TaxID=547042 RepID=S0FB39_9BACT|nr:hypothetical protein BACCOPRO_02530 [Phocaeicola coprophilus DSM 18228 = JCM 13818]
MSWFPSCNFKFYITESLSKGSSYLVKNTFFMKKYKLWAGYEKRVERKCSLQPFL